jgi:hypothetical protein
MCEDVAQNFGDERTGCCITTTHLLTLTFSPGKCLTKNNMSVVPHPPYSPDLAPCNFSLFPRWKIKLKGRRFDTTEAIDAESQAVQNILIEHDFQDVFKKWQKRWERCIRAEGDHFDCEGGQ